MWKCSISAKVIKKSQSDYLKDVQYLWSILFNAHVCILSLWLLKKCKVIFQKKINISSWRGPFSKANLTMSKIQTLVFKYLLMCVFKQVMCCETVFFVCKKGVFKVQDQDLDKGFWSTVVLRNTNRISDLLVCFDCNGHMTAFCFDAGRVSATFIIPFKALNSRLHSFKSQTCQVTVFLILVMKDAPMADAWSHYYTLVCLHSKICLIIDSSPWRKLKWSLYEWALSSCLGCPKWLKKEMLRWWP